VQHLEGANYGVCVLVATLARAWMVAVFVAGASLSITPALRRICGCCGVGADDARIRVAKIQFSVSQKPETGDETVVRETRR